MNNITEFKEIPKKHRPIPFWSWNDHRELFGNLEEDVFPLIIKSLNAKGTHFILQHKYGTAKFEVKMELLISYI